MIMANNLLRQFELHSKEYEEKALEVLRSGWYVLGKEALNGKIEFLTNKGREVLRHG